MVLVKDIDIYYMDMRAYGKDFDRYVENGKKKYYKTDQDIYTALVMSSKDAGTGGFATLLKVLSIPVRVLRSGVTHGVGFILRNPMRDTVNAGMVGDHFTPIMTTLKGAFSILSKKDGWFEEFVKSGASQGVAYLSPKTKAELARSIRMGTGKTRILNELKNPPRALWRLLGEMAQFTELATRVGQYRVSRERGADMGKAAYEARDLLNYQRGGRVSRAISKVNPFFNAQIQGVAKGLRSMYHDGKVDAKSLARGMLYITLPSMLVTLWNYGDDDRRKKYSRSRRGRETCSGTLWSARVMTLGFSNFQSPSTSGSSSGLFPRGQWTICTPTIRRPSMTSGSRSSMRCHPSGDRFS